MIPDETLTAILEAREAATAGEWVYRPERFDDWGTIRATPKPGEDVGGFVAFARAGNNHLTDDQYAKHRADKTDPYFANAAFITLACNNAAELVSEVRALREALKPFAEFADALNHGNNLNVPMKTIPDETPVYGYNLTILYRGDFRRAAQTLKDRNDG